MDEPLPVTTPIKRLACVPEKWLVRHGEDAKFVLEAGRNCLRPKPGDGVWAKFIKVMLARLYRYRFDRFIVAYRHIGRLRAGSLFSGSGVEWVSACGAGTAVGAKTPNCLLECEQVTARRTWLDDVVGKVTGWSHSCISEESKGTYKQASP